MLFVPTRYLFDPVLHILLRLIEAALGEHLEIYRLLLEDPAGGAPPRTLRAHLRRADDRWLKRFQGSEQGGTARHAGLPRRTLG